MHGGSTANKEFDPALCTLQMKCFSLGPGRMWEHAGLICFILDAHRSVLPTKLLHSTIRPVKWSAQCVGIVPATTEASGLLSRPALQPNVPSLHVCCVGHPPGATSVYLLLPPRSLQTLSTSPHTRW